MEGWYLPGPTLVLLSLSQRAPEGVAGRPLPLLAAWCQGYCSVLPGEEFLPSYESAAPWKPPVHVPLGSQPLAEVQGLVILPVGMISMGHLCSRASGGQGL